MTDKERKEIVDVICRKRGWNPDTIYKLPAKRLLDEYKKILEQKRRNLNRPKTKEPDIENPHRDFEETEQWISKEIDGEDTYDDFLGPKEPNRFGR